MEKVIAVVGPTASGKSDLAVRLALQFSGEIVSADARQIYKGLDIGTGKITHEEMRGVPHHLLDVANPQDTFTAQDFVQLGREAIADIISRDKLPIIAGGSGFYIDALVGSIAFPEVPPNENLRTALAGKSTDELYEMLLERDPQRAATIEQKNPRRLIRALEIVEALGSVPAPTKVRPLYDVLWIGIAPQMETLREKIYTRLIKRLEAGMVNEARELHKHGLTLERMDELGLEYRALARLLRGDVAEDEVIADLEREIWKYAKRQMTYWRQNKDIKWFAPGEIEAIEKEARAFLPD